MDNFEYFMNERIDEIFKTDYKVSYDDYLRISMERILSKHNFVNIKNIDIKTKYIIYGYIRKYYNGNYNVPSLIHNICMYYYAKTDTLNIANGFTSYTFTKQINSINYEFIFITDD